MITIGQGVQKNLNYVVGSHEFGCVIEAICMDCIAQLVANIQELLKLNLSIAVSPSNKFPRT